MVVAIENEENIYAIQSIQMTIEGYLKFVKGYRLWRCIFYYSGKGLLLIDKSIDNNYWFVAIENVENIFT